MPGNREHRNERRGARAEAAGERGGRRPADPDQGQDGYVPLDAAARGREPACALCLAQQPPAMGERSTAALQCARRYVGGRRRAGESAASAAARAEDATRRAATQRGRRPVFAGVGRGRGAHAQVACRVWQGAMRTSTSKSRKRPGWPK